MFFSKGQDQQVPQDQFGATEGTIFTILADPCKGKHVGKYFPVEMSMSMVLILPAPDNEASSPPRFNYGQCYW